MRVSNFTLADVQVGNASSAQISTPIPAISDGRFVSQEFQSLSSLLKDSNSSTTNYSNNTIIRSKLNRTSPKHQPPKQKTRSGERWHSLRKQAQISTEPAAVKDEPQFDDLQTQTAAQTTNLGIRLCETNAQCDHSAECVVVHQQKQCYCINDLKSPDPITGGCGVPSHDTQNSDQKNGVIHTEHLQTMLQVSVNVTHMKPTNETSSKLHLQSNGSASGISLLQIIPAVFGSIVFITIVLAISIIYRRRHLSKHFCAMRNGDTIVRNNDGTLLLDRMNNISKNPTYFCPNTNTKRQNVKEVAMDHLKLLEVVGEGAFGQVFRGELYIPENESKKQVAVKVLKDGANREAIEDFDREVEIMSSFDHDNILKLLCVIVEGTHGNPYMIFEFMEHGDLSQVLRKNDPQFKNFTGKRLMLTKIDMVDVSVQIANGMCYLATQRFVHRDLATRNCLVGGGLIVKISDFGMSRDVYTTDYYRIGGSRMLPVRWMSPEAIKYGRFTSESDIWAYGVVLWEIFSFGKQPYCGHTNEEVLHFLDQGILLQRPEDCPSTVYHVMLGCWKKDPKERLVFDRLVKHLTEYRNRLMKPPHTHQLNSNSKTDIISTLHSSTLGVPSEVNDKAGDAGVRHCEVRDGGSSGRALNYLTLADSEGIHCVDNIALGVERSSSVDEKECVSTGNYVLNEINSFRDSPINSSWQDINSAKMCQKNHDKDTCKPQGISASNVCLPRGISHGMQATVANDFHHPEVKKLPAKRLASYPSLSQSGKAAQNRNRANKRYGSLKHVPLKYTAELLGNNIQNDFSVSALELCPSVTSVSQNTSMFIHSHNMKSGPHIHTKCGSMNHMTNKVTDKLSFPEQPWNVKSQALGVAEGCPTFCCFAETLDLHPMCNHSQREVAINEYSIPEQLPV